MYVKRVKFANYGPINDVDIRFPFRDSTPLPVVLVGPNGSGKSIVLSQIINGLCLAKDHIFPDSREVDENKVFKLRSPIYIQTGQDHYYARVEFEREILLEELFSRTEKSDSAASSALRGDGDVQRAWASMRSGSFDYWNSNVPSKHDDILELFNSNCVLVFPHNRMEEPAWMNEDHLRYRAEFAERANLRGYTTRNLFQLSPLRENQNWLFDVVFDRAAFEVQTLTVNVPVSGSGSPQIPMPFFAGYSGNATRVYELALELVREVIGPIPGARFGVGQRNNRVMSIESSGGQVVPNIFQLSSGESSILNVFLSILRDFDMTRSRFENAEDIRGLVVIDEMDLHLHVTHQYRVVPKLIKTFPNVQFVMTTHSPLFVLGLANELGEDGFAVLELPHGSAIRPEGFEEFDAAYKSFARTERFSSDMDAIVSAATKPILFVEGRTGRDYLIKAAELLDASWLIDKCELADGGGKSDMGKYWNNVGKSFARALPQRVVLLFDCDAKGDGAQKGNLFRRLIPFNADGPIKTGIENLFSEATLVKAIDHKRAFIDVVNRHKKRERGEEIDVPPKWTVNANEKTNLCNWLCSNGTNEDFAPFQLILDLVREIVVQT